MSDFFQSGHPDADQIGAFVEQALPAHEREQMLVHLADCAECRAVVALSMPPMEAPAPTIAERKRWFSLGPLAWPAFAAFATLAVIVVSIHQGAIAPKAPAPNQVANAPQPASSTFTSKTIESIPANDRNLNSATELAQAPAFLPAGSPKGNEQPLNGAQQPFSQDEALKQIYSQYDAQKKTAQWVCIKKQQAEPLHEGWPCWKEYATVSVSVEMKVEVKEGDTEKIYMAMSAKPANYPDHYECHACAPAIGIGVFAWQAQHWVLQSANAAVGFYGGWGSSPEIKLVQIGPDKNGFLLSTKDLAQGYSSSCKTLLMPIDKTVAEAWVIQNEQDNLGAIDPEDKNNRETPYKSSATFKFFAASDGSSKDYYDIEVNSTGSDREDFSHPIKPENWTEIYRFKDGEYKLLRHTDSIKQSNSKSAHPAHETPASPRKVK